MPTETSVSIVIPAKDEAGNIASLFREIHAVLHHYHDFEIVLVDDGSEDQTLETARTAAATLGCPFQGIRHRTSIGQSGALRSGIDAARFPWIITMDGDGQNDPADIPLLLQQAATVNKADFCIAGYRKDRRDTAWKRFQSRLANRVRNAILRDGVPDTGCGLKLFPKATFTKLPWFDHIHRFLPALIRGWAATYGWWMSTTGQGRRVFPNTLPGTVPGWASPTCSVCSGCCIVIRCRRS